MALRPPPTPTTNSNHHIRLPQTPSQLFVLAEAVEELPRRPKNLPPCPETCIYHAAPWTKPFVQEKFGNSGFELP